MAGRRRGNGEGSITLQAGKDGAPDRWVARLSLPDGRRKALYAKTRQEAARKLTKALRDRDTGLMSVGDDRQTVGQYAERWLEMLRPAVKPRTLLRYSEDLRLHVLPTLGTVKLARLSAQHVQSLYSALLAEGKLSSTTIFQVHTTLSHALKDAMRLGIIPRNPCTLVTPPRPVHVEMHVLTPAQVGTLLRAAHGERLEAFYVLMCYTGLRLGEALALQWSALDLEAGTLQVRYTLHHPHGKGSEWELLTPKTAKSRRRIELPPTVVEALRQHRKRQLEERLALGAGWTDHGFVFAREDGLPYRGIHVLQRHFYPLLERAGLPRIRLHDLRHTAATLLLLQNVPAKVVSELLGHSSVGITLDRYSHVLPSMQKDAASAMERLLSAQ